MSTEDNRKRKAIGIGLTVLFSAFVFLLLSVTMAIIVGVSVLLVRQGFLQIPQHKTYTVLLISQGIASVILGTLLTVFAIRVPLRPLRRLIDGMNRLADGHYEERIHLGKIRSLREIQESFNKLAAELENTEMLRSDFVNRFSHEFKTPIVSIRGFARLLKKSPLDDTQREYVEIIIDESTRLAGMASSVLDLSRLENTGILSGQTDFNLSEQIRRCVLSLQEKWSARGLEVLCDFEEYSVRGREDMLRQVWTNLLDNAIRFSPQGGGIEIRLEAGPDAGRVTVTNHGPAIPGDQIRHLFEKFWQGTNPEKSGGNGIGLAVVRQIAELHGGNVEVSSDESATSFTVVLPNIRRMT